MNYYLFLVIIYFEALFFILMTYLEYNSLQKRKLLHEERIKEAENNKYKIELEMTNANIKLSEINQEEMKKWNKKKV
jgi:hypothetical protein